ncbi:hypothetical protein SJAG_00148 [Schizosaccharomyces japonicus yFS275]|uniref:Uncharacterized protein n=1 Tax=Schizosaccharomyces japonicus (strain yFS275 / FY16936) TaxID=402676 RepID=B6JXK6_SCHJY|nr:hypothetical protein SJAG_00148 [Schizosaccharomyces japonicus yFS275]EEB05150.1 hypothetical protein SJAG_00148 [Schizosaccharomyces japonicus yFS275]
MLWKRTNRCIRPPQLLKSLQCRSSSASPSFQNEIHKLRVKFQQELSTARECRLKKSKDTRPSARRNNTFTEQRAAIDALIPTIRYEPIKELPSAEFQKQRKNNAKKMLFKKKATLIKKISSLYTSPSNFIVSHEQLDTEIERAFDPTFFRTFDPLPASSSASSSSFSYESLFLDDLNDATLQPKLEKVLLRDLRKKV